MSHKSKRQKIDRESNAAYITSQPLYDALRNATTAVSDQKALLKTARDTVQVLHVKVVNDDEDQHALYMRSIIEAWMGATEAYHEVFRQLVAISAADPTEGRAATSAHGTLVSLLKTVQNASELAQKVLQGEDDSDEEDDDDDMKEEESAEEEKVNIKKEAESDSASESPPTVMSSKPAPTPLATGLHKRPFFEDQSADEGANKTQKFDNKTSDALRQRKAKKNPKSRRRALKKAEAEAATAQQAQPEPAIKDQSPSPPSIKAEHAASPPPVVEYEDVQAEVDARIKAKAEKLAAKKDRKAEKKRKRESGDSFIKEVVVKSESEPEPLAIKKEVEKPNKKKAKQVHVKVEDDTATEAVLSKQERAAPKANGAAKPSVKLEKREAESTATEGGGGKKRKTKKA